MGVLCSRMCGTWWQYQPRKSRMTVPRAKPSPQWASCTAGCVAPDSSVKLARAGWLRHKRKPCHSGKPSQMGWRQRWSHLQVKVTSAFASTFLRGEVTSESKPKVHLQARSWEWVTCKWKSRVLWQARSWKVKLILTESHLCICKHVLERGGDFWVKVTSALASTILRVNWLASESRECFGKHILVSEVDLRVKELWSSWWTRARWHRNKLFKSVHGTFRSSSRGGGEGKSWRSVVEVAAEVRLMILAHSRLLIYPRRLEEWQFGCFPGLWWTESRAYGRAEESSGTQEGVVT